MKNRNKINYNNNKIEVKDIIKYLRVLPAESNLNIKCN